MKTIHTALRATLFAVTALALLPSCEKGIDEEAVEQQTVKTESTKQQKVDVVFRVSNFRQVPFSTIKKRAMVDLTTYCTRLNYVVYKDGKKVDSRSQLKGDSGFGEVTMTLKEGTYNLMVLAHSSVGGNPTVSDPEKIQFTNALGYSDTFSYYGELKVSKTNTTHELVLTRNVSCLKFTVNDDFPSEVGYMKFHYTGGSGVLNAITGYGAQVNSQQEKLVNMAGRQAPLTFSIYTFLQQDEANLQLTVTAYESDEKTIVMQRTYSDVPMKYQKVTEYDGDFFEHESDNGFKLMGETDWGEPYCHVDY